MRGELTHDLDRVRLRTQADAIGMMAALAQAHTPPKEPLGCSSLPLVCDDKHWDLTRSEDDERLRLPHDSKAFIERPPQRRPSNNGHHTLASWCGLQAVL